VLDDWSTMLSKFVKVMPRDNKRVLAERKRQTDAALDSVAG
jgi:glutamate synthase domain-containing protein 3